MRYASLDHAEDRLREVELALFRAADHVLLNEPDKARKELHETTDLSAVIQDVGRLVEGERELSLTSGETRPQFRRAAATHSVGRAFVLLRESLSREMDVRSCSEITRSELEAERTIRELCRRNGLLRAELLRALSEKNDALNKLNALDEGRGCACAVGEGCSAA